MSPRHLALWAASALCLCLFASASTARPLPPSNIDLGGCSECAFAPGDASVANTCALKAQDICIRRSQAGQPCSPADRDYETSVCCQNNCEECGTANGGEERAIYPTGPHTPPEGVGHISIICQDWNGGTEEIGWLQIFSEQLCHSSTVCRWEPLGGNPLYGAADF